MKKPFVVKQILLISREQYREYAYWCLGVNGEASSEM